MPAAALLLLLLVMVLPGHALGAGPMTFAKAHARVAPSVVTVAARLKTGQRLGGGIIIDGGGLVLCASQTLDGALGVEVRLPSGVWQPAVVLGVDQALRAAVLKVELGGGGALRAAAVAPHAVLKVQDWVVAVDRGPDGAVHAVTGLVTVVPQGVEGRPPVVMTDAPGAPGSPLVNARGEVVAMSLGKVDRRRGRATPLEPLRAFVLRHATGLQSGAVNPE
jgi:S1-C subfamily serine protease